MTSDSDAVYGRCPRCERIYLVTSADDARRRGHGWTTEAQITEWSACPRDGTSSTEFGPLKVQEVARVIPPAATTAVVVAPDDWLARVREGAAREGR